MRLFQQKDVLIAAFYDLVKNNFYLIDWFLSIILFNEYSYYRNSRFRGF